MVTVQHTGRGWLLKKCSLSKFFVKLAVTVIWNKIDHFVRLVLLNGKLISVSTMPGHKSPIRERNFCSSTRASLFINISGLVRIEATTQIRLVRGYWIWRRYDDWWTWHWIWKRHTTQTCDHIFECKPKRANLPQVFNLFESGYALHPFPFSLPALLKQSAFHLHRLWLKNTVRAWENQRLERITMSWNILTKCITKFITIKRHLEIETTMSGNIQYIGVNIETKEMTKLWTTMGL